MTTEKFVLSCGMEMLVDYMPHLRSVASGLWVKCGSVYEDPSLAGASHFLEHMLFEMPEGSALKRLAAGGARVNAFTSPFETMYHIIKSYANRNNSHSRILNRFHHMRIECSI